LLAVINCSVSGDLLKLTKMSSHLKILEQHVADWQQPESDQNLLRI
jgi:hypothetical protein